ncbi:MAG: hypothetical protein R3C11_11455 [Planctomycetaceae bacterium]
MSRLKSFGLLGSLGLVCLIAVGCNMVPQEQLRISQLRARQLYQQNQAMAASSQSLSVEKQQLEQKLASMNSQLQTANSQLE